ncbi:unnamed protein product [Sphagnum jensenii]|uniref:Glycosyltransferase n=1 Tax=Sphagnum jensenii TaxID=128206 RepID=A0ABP1BZ70_9BRYO
MSQSRQNDLMLHLFPEFLLIKLLEKFKERARRSPQVRVQELEDPNLVSKKFGMVIKVLAFNRLESLIRCLTSLANADYGGDTVKLHILVDHFRFESSESDPSTEEEEEEDDSTPEEGGAHEILMYVDGFKWQHGPKEVHYRSKKLGLQGQWIEAWWPSNDDEFAFIVEDDVELSRLFYRYLRGIVSTYYYKPQNYDPSIYGVSLQCPQLVPSKGGLPLVVNATGNLFLYQMVGTWGQLLFPRPWKEFRIWYDKCKSKDMRPFLGGMVTNTWNNTQLGEQMWTPWFVKFVHSRGYFNLYTKLQSDQALSILHRDHGGDGGGGGHVNASIKSAAAEPNLKLISVDEAINISLWEMEPLKLIKWYDFCFREVKVGRIANTVAELSGILRLVEVNKTVLIVNAVHVQGWVVQNWLCQMQSLGLRNFVLLGDDRPFVRDLARRGHAVVILSAALSTELLGQEISGIDIIREDDLRQDLITMQVVDAVLHLGYRVWLTRADAMWVHNLLSLFGNKMEQLKVDVAGIELTRDHHRFHRSLLYISNSNATVHLWGKLVKDFLEAAKSDAPDPDLGQLPIMQGESALWWKFLLMSLKSEADFGYRDLSTMLVQPDLMIIGLDDLPPNRRVAMNTSVTNTHIVLLDGVARRKPSDVIQRLNAAGLWFIDKELSCKHIHCQPKLQ